MNGFEYMLDNFFYIRIAVFSALGLCCALAGPMLLDPKLETHVRYGAREYHWNCTSLVWLLFVVLAFCIPYFVLPHFETAVYKYVISVAPILLFGVIAAFIFPPERPHMGVVVSCLGFALIILVTVGIRLSANDFSNLSAETPFESRLEAVKAAIAFWQMIAVYASAGYLAFSVTWLYAMWFTTEKMVSSAEDRFILGQAQVGVAVAVTVCVVIGPLLEAFSNAFKAMDYLLSVKK